GADVRAERAEGTKGYSLSRGSGVAALRGNPRPAPHDPRVGSRPALALDRGPMPRISTAVPIVPYVAAEPCIGGAGTLSCDMTCATTAPGRSPWGGRVRTHTVAWTARP